MNIELAKQIEESSKEIKKTFDNYLENQLKKIKGYEQLNEDSKAICKIFFCIDILYKLENIKK